MQTHSQRFFCVPCKRYRWPGDCPHKVVMATMPGVLPPPRGGDPAVCTICSRDYVHCTCPPHKTRMRTRESAQAKAARIRALTGCPCQHHIVAWDEDDIEKIIKCSSLCCTVSVMAIV